MAQSTGSAVAAGSVGGGESGRSAAVLLALLVLFIALLPVVATTAVGTHFVRLAFAALLVGAAVVASERRWMVWLALALAASAILADWGQHVMPTRTGAIVRLLPSTALLWFSSGLLFRALLRERRFSPEMILLGIAVYLLLALGFALLFALVELLVPGAFLAGGSPLASSLDASLGPLETLTYYSFVTITTLGYGDIGPAHPIAATLAFVEAVVGQLYVAIVIARLVGIQVAQAMISHGEAGA